MHLTEVSCPNALHCSDVIPFAAVSCAGCGHQDVGYPNVRYANDPAETSALDEKVADARYAAASNGSAAALDRFHDCVLRSVAITVMNPVDLLHLLSPNKLWVSFYKHSRSSGGRSPEPNKWDMNRTSNDGKVNPQYYDEVNYAALSLADFGSGWYGGCHITLKGDRIASRTSVFWENPFRFLKRFHLQPDEMVPAGFRACWERRADLAVAKLHDKVTSSTDDSDFADILLERDATRGDTDFIEVHIFGAVSPTAFKEITVDRKLLHQDDIPIWDSLKGRAAKQGILVREISIA